MVSHNQVVDFVNVLGVVQNKAKSLMLEETIKDKILVLLPFLMIQEEQEEDEREE